MANFYVYYPPNDIVTAVIPGPVTVNQGTTPWIISGTVLANQGTNPWTVDGTVNVGNFPSSFVVTQGTNPWTVDGTVNAVQSGTWDIGTLTSITDPVTVNQGTSPWIVSGSTTITGPVTVDQGTTPWVIDGTVSASQSGTWNIDTVTTITNPVTVTQGTTPWIVSGTFTSSDDHNYGVVGANTLRTAAQIGNATGAADFDSGATSPQTLRTESNQGIPNSLANAWPVEVTDGTNIIIPNPDGSINIGNFPSTFIVDQGTSPWVISGNVNASQSGVWNIGTVTTITNPVTVDQGTSPWIIDGTVAATQSGTWTTGRTWVLDSSTDSVSVSNFPGTFIVTQGTTPWVDNVAQFGGNNVVTGTGTSGLGIPRVTVSNDSNILATQSGTWNIGTVSNITNPVTVNQGTTPWVISGSTTVSGTVTANQGTTPWVVSGTVLVSNFPTTVDTNYGTVGASTIRTASQIGNATGAAAFNAGTTTAQTLRVVLPTDQTAIPVTQSGTWTTGRTWTLSSSTDSVNIGNFPATQSVTQGTSPWVVSGTVAATQSGTWNIGTVTTITNPVTVNQGTSPWVVSGTVAATQSGTWTVQQGTPPWTIQGDSASGAAKAGNPVQIGGVFNTTQPTVTTGQTVEAQSTARGAQIVATGVDPFTVTQGTSPWVVSGTAIVTASTISTPSNTIVSVSNSVSTQILASNSSRRMAYVTNNNNKSLWIKLGAAAVVGQGIEVAGGGSFGIDSTTLWIGTVNGIMAGGASANIDVFEGTP